jgi:signal peptidase II
VQRKYLILLAVVVPVLLLDQWTKYVAVAELTNRFEGTQTVSERLSAFLSPSDDPPFRGLHFEPKRSVTVSESFFRFRYAENPGAAFSLFGTLPDHVRVPFVHLVTIGAVGLILFFFRKLNASLPGEKLTVWGLSLVVGGALGNWVDRLARGFVVDFLEAHWFHQAYWPAFNIADMAIVIGVGLTFLDGLLHRQRETAPAEASS